MNHQLTVASQALGGDTELPQHRPLAQIKCDAFVTSAHCIAWAAIHVGKYTQFRWNLN